MNEPSHSMALEPGAVMPEGTVLPHPPAPRFLAVLYDQVRLPDGRCVGFLWGRCHVVSLDANASSEPAPVVLGSDLATVARRPPPDFLRVGFGEGAVLVPVFNVAFLRRSDHVPTDLAVEDFFVPPSEVAGAVP